MSFEHINKCRSCVRICIGHKRILLSDTCEYLISFNLFIEYSRVHLFTFLMFSEGGVVSCCVDLLWEGVVRFHSARWHAFGSV